MRKSRRACGGTHARFGRTKEIYTFSGGTPGLTTFFAGLMTCFVGPSDAFSGLCGDATERSDIRFYKTGVFQLSDALIRCSTGL